MYGLLIFCSSPIAFSSAAAYCSRPISVNEPSVVTTIPIVECSFITFHVPSCAAFVNGISVSDHGVFTCLSLSFSMCPVAPSTIYPTQSISLTRTLIPSTGQTSAASDGTNLGSVVIIVVPDALCGSSSFALFLSCSSVIDGITKRSINLLMNVDLPVLTGPTTPRYISPFVLILISLYKSNSLILITMPFQL